MFVKQKFDLVEQWNIYIASLYQARRFPNCFSLRLPWTGGGIMTRLRAGRSEVRFLAVARVFSLLQNDHKSSPSLLFNGYRGSLPWGLSGRGLWATTHLCLVRRLEWSYTSIPLYAFMACTGITNHNDACEVCFWIKLCPRVFSRQHYWITINSGSLLSAHFWRPPEYAVRTWETCLCNETVKCSLWGRDRIFKCYLD